MQVWRLPVNSSYYWHFCLSLLLHTASKIGQPMKWHWICTVAPGVCSVVETPLPLLSADRYTEK